MPKYDVRFCRCGRIHLIPFEKTQDAVENNEHLLLVCGNCGRATMIGADITKDYDVSENDCYMMYSYEVCSHDDAMSLTSVDFQKHDDTKPLREIYYSKGIGIPMMTGNDANYNWQRPVDTNFDIWKLEHCKSIHEVNAIIKQFNEDCLVVDMKKLIRRTPEDYLDAISGFACSYFDWSGTKWDKWKT